MRLQSPRKFPAVLADATSSSKVPPSDGAKAEDGATVHRNAAEPPSNTRASESPKVHRLNYHICGTFSSHRFHNDSASAVQAKPNKKINVSTSETTFH
ncbi:hypothetical protein NDU88_000939 [Pleurodeles waltl]|uniref:Uncharacterized protein n=1 Tax=Pleurodeles waltl TaxID=8319 RepID=A0AAV7VUZ2_PLEWA|nr:hypothetical protein NDU88_000939 [Pleurodeles waltl]